MNQLLKYTLKNPICCLRYHTELTGNVIVYCREKPALNLRS